ncbi:MAG TPA: hypothetical protein VE343_09325 [Streptosporangiaceae bacterium]|nr:hypothetical protein [Streptosporangiaceae bacterium]
MQNNAFMIILWVACGTATIIAAALAGRRGRARYLGRAAVGVLFIAGGALLHVINLAAGEDYAGFAGPAHFWWVTQAWNAIVVPNHILFIGLLAAFEAAAGVLAIAGGRRTQLGYLAVNRVLPGPLAVRVDRDLVGARHDPGDAAAVACRAARRGHCGAAARIGSRCVASSS